VSTLPGEPRDPTHVAEWAGHSVAVLLRVYAKCISGREELNRRRIEEALRDDDDELADPDNEPPGNKDEPSR
jgi:hypothetical protein